MPGYRLRFALVLFLAVIPLVFSIGTATADDDFNPPIQQVWVDDEENINIVGKKFPNGANKLKKVTIGGHDVIDIVYDGTSDSIFAPLPATVSGIAGDYDLKVVVKKNGETKNRHWDRL
jgi:hypothetical protein